MTRVTVRKVGDALQVLQIVTAIVAIVALAIAVIDLGVGRASRRDSARDSCQLIRGLVVTGTPASRQKALQAYIARTPLHDCRVYANRLVR